MTLSSSRCAANVAFVLRAAVAGAFIVAAVLKLRDATAFAEQIANYQLLPELSNYLAVALPGVELIAASALLLTKAEWRWAAGLVLLGLLVVFTTAIGRAWFVGINLECGCFGVGSTHIGPWPIVRNLCLSAALLGAWCLERSSPAADR
ncbi:MAG TPA: MauE/DoxX family redox-associated membrane protein [Polyangiaceae bacterium]